MSKYNLWFALFTLAFLLQNSLTAQIVDSTWTPISYDEKLVYIDLSDIHSFTGDDIFVWTLENHSQPLEIESIDEKVFKTKTYYLMNKKLRKYSLKEVIYYDNKNNVLEDFTYNVDSADPEYKYSYPIFNASLADLILQRCLREIESVK